MAQEMMAPGWIKVWRKLASDRLWLADKFTKGQAWVDLLLIAQGLDKTEYYDGQYAHYKAGTVYKSLRWLSDRWQWNRRTVVNFLDSLVSANMIEVTTSRTHGTVIRIKNWEDYQSGQNSNQKVVTTLLDENREKVHQGFSQFSEKSAPQESESTDQNSDFLAGALHHGTAPRTAPRGAPRSAHKKEDKEDKEEKNLIYVHSKGGSGSASAPLLEGGSADPSDNGKDRIPERWRDSFATYEDYWRWRNQ